ncbi:MAG: cytochrome ubiquinol oxidase subunit I [Caldimicrobium sp.]|nr:cytochrome ubiquinol oxidase subunit I [Caldimicrobium sp.]
MEVVGIIVYYYTLGKVDQKTHLKLGWIFAIGSWTTMIIIVGILAFMLSPGKWPETGIFFDGFFNQTYWPQLLIKTSFMFAIASVYAIVIATTIIFSTERIREMIRKPDIFGTLMYSNQIIAKDLPAKGVKAD